MATQTFTLIDEAHAAHSIELVLEGQRLLVDPGSLEAATGWSVKPEGFCQGALCVPAGDAVDADGRVDVARFAARLGRPLVVDAPERAVSLGAAATTRADALQSLEAPDFARKSRDEIGVLADSFARMRASVVQAMKMLES